MSYFFDNFFLIISIIIFICPVLQFVSLSKNRVNYYLALSHLSFGFLMFYFWLFQSGFIHQHPLLMNMDASITFLIGPFLYNYISTILYGKKKVTISNLLFFLPAVIAFIFLLCYNYSSSIFYDTEIRLFENYKSIKLLYILQLLSDMYLTIFIILSSRLAFLLVKKTPKEERRKVVPILGIGVIAFVLLVFLFIAYMLKNEKLVIIAVGLCGLNSVSFFLFSYRYPETMQNEYDPNKKNKSINNHYSLDYQNEVMQKLQFIMKEEGGFTNPDVSLQSLSHKIGVPNHHLSSVLHEKLNMNFRQYINYYRIERAKQLLIEYPDATIIEIAFKVGFNSKTSFNVNFSNCTGITPTLYRKKNK